MLSIVLNLCISIEISLLFGVSLISSPDKSMQLLVCFSYGVTVDEENGPSEYGELSLHRKMEKLSAPAS